MNASTKSGRPKGRTVQHPKRRDARRSRPLDRRKAVWLVLLAVATGGAIVAVTLADRDGGGRSGGAAALPATADYHSLLVSPKNPDELLLGTHDGVFRSTDGGGSWSFAELAGRDAMSLARASSTTFWAAGHNVLSRSSDAGASWEDVAPSGLPGLDIHGFAADPRHPNRLFAAVAGAGLYRSTDGGESFTEISSTVGPGVMALAAMPDGRLLAGDMSRGLLASADGGRSWTRAHEARLMGLAVDPTNPKRVLASAPGVLRSTDGGVSWSSVLDLPDGAGPIAWSPSSAGTAFVVGLDRVLYRTRDGGATWSPVESGEGS